MIINLYDYKINLILIVYDWLWSLMIDHDRSKNEVVNVRSSTWTEHKLNSISTRFIEIIWNIYHYYDYTINSDIYTKQTRISEEERLTINNKLHKFVNVNSLRKKKIHYIRRMFNSLKKKKKKLSNRERHNNTIECHFEVRLLRVYERPGSKSLRYSSRTWPPVLPRPNCLPSTKPASQSVLTRRSSSRVPFTYRMQFSASARV